jgi:hypothetical protein
VRWRNAESGEEIVFDGSKRLLKAGEMLTSIRRLADLSGVGMRGVRHALSVLEQGHTIAVLRAHRGTQKGTIIRVIDSVVLETFDARKDTQRDAQDAETGHKEGTHKKKGRSEECNTESPESVCEAVFSPEVERAFALAVGYLEQAGHKVPDTAKRTADAKNALRLMVERDGIPAEEIMDAWDFVSQDTGNGTWPGWRSVVQSISGFRANFPKIRPQAARWAAAQREAGLTWRSLTEEETRRRLEEVDL